MFEMHDLNIVCPKCNNPNYMKLMSGENVGKLNVKCTNCNSYFAFNDLEKGGNMKLIDADAFRHRMYHEVFEKDSEDQRWDSGCWMRYRLFDKTLEEQPAVDAVEVIRCKDCKHYGWTENRIPSEREWWCYEWNDAREETDFCSHAERRQDETD